MKVGDLRALIRVWPSWRRLERASSWPKAVVRAAIEPTWEEIFGTVELCERPNPYGDGMVVFCPRTVFAGVTRRLAWLVLDAQAFPINGASKTVTPSLPWFREATETVQSRAGVGTYSHAQQLLDAVWPDRKR